jgi:hypothetical protein
MVLLALSGRYGFHRDELYFLVAGRRLDWGYVDQPPLVPLLARAAETVGGTNPIAIRVLPALALGAVAVVTALIAKRFGGGGPAQIAAAIGGAGFGFALAVGHLLSTATFDLLFSVVAFWILIRLLDGADPRWWVGLGFVVGLGLLNKYLVGVLVGSIVIGLVLDRSRRLLIGPWPWLGGVIALAIAAPNLRWQATHGWPQIEMSRSLARGSDGPLGFVAEQILLLTVILVIPTAIGWWRLVRDPGWGRWRPLAIGYLVAFFVFLVSGGKAYYVAPFFPVFIAAGAVGSERVGRSGPSVIPRWWIIAVLIGAVLALPIVPRNMVHRVDATGELGETIGWEELVEQVDVVFQSLPERERPNAVIFTGSYGQAGAIDILGSQRGLPAASSGHNNYWLWGPPDSHGAIIALGPVGDALEPICPVIERVGTISNPWGVENEEAGNPILLCRAPTGSLADIWERVRHYN